jgi:hypothetical protein
VPPMVSTARWHVFDILRTTPDDCFACTLVKIVYADPQSMRCVKTW